MKNKKRDESRTTPAGLWVLGDKFFRIVEYVPEEKRRLFPCYYLLSHSIELTLKAFLLTKGHTVPELIKISHDLEELLRLAELRGICGLVSFEERHLDAIELANAIYKKKEWEYHVRAHKDYPIIDDLYSFASVLLDGTRGECAIRRA